MGQTPVQIAQLPQCRHHLYSGDSHQSLHQSSRIVQSKNKHHLIATFHEIAMHNKAVATRRAIRARRFYHFRDWTTVSHAWGTPSAQLAALTVLMVGETYKRGLLPRLPMDAWYKILNMVPRHQLRQDDCNPAKEQAALAQYLSILQEARTVIDAKEALQAALDK